MPHKTRKEKIIADLRRKIAVHTQRVEPDIRPSLLKIPKNDSSVSSSFDSSFVFPPSSVEIRNKETSSSVLSSLALYDYRYISSDLRKTFFWAGFVLLIEFVLYWALELGGTQFLSSILKR